MARITKERVEEIVGEPVVAFADAQSLESRYGKSVRAGGVASSAVLGTRVRRLRRPDAVDLPRFVTIAAGKTAVHVFGYRKTEAYAIGSIERSSLELHVQRRLFWTRLTLVDKANGRSYMAFLGRIIRGRKALLAALA
jgi:hypothetical protein